MSDSSGSKKLPVLPLVLGGAAIIAGCVLIGITLYSFLPLSPGKAPSSPTPEQVRTVSFPTATLPMPVDPSPTPTSQPAETETTTPAETQQTIPTSTPAPTEQPATNPAVPTEAPPPTEAPTLAPSPIEGLTNITFTVDNPVVSPNERIVFRFTVTNSGTEDIIFGYLGVAVLDGAGNNVHFHTSWTQWFLSPGKTENYVDGLAIGTPGAYQMRLSACFPGVDECNNGEGTWTYLGSPVDVTVN